MEVSVAGAVALAHCRAVAVDPVEANPPAVIRREATEGVRVIVLDLQLTVGRPAGRLEPELERRLGSPGGEQGDDGDCEQPRAQTHGLVPVQRVDLGEPVEHHDPDRNPDDRQADQVGDDHPEQRCPPADQDEVDRPEQE